MAAHVDQQVREVLRAEALRAVGLDPDDFAAVDRGQADGVSSRARVAPAGAERAGFREPRRAEAQGTSWLILLAMLRDQWSALRSPSTIVEMANVILALQSAWPLLEPKRRSAAVDEDLEDLLKAVTDFYLEGDGRSLQDDQDRLIALCESLFDQIWPRVGVARSGRSLNGAWWGPMDLEQVRIEVARRKRQLADCGDTSIAGQKLEEAVATLQEVLRDLPVSLSCRRSG